MSSTASTSTNIETAFRERFAQSAELAVRGKQVFPDGVTHDGRHLKPFPIYVEHASGSKKYSVEGHEIVDFWSGHGALLLGHCHPAMVEAVQAQVARGTHFGACHELELQWGEWVQKLVPSAGHVRFTSSGTEATLMALRLARIATGRSKVLKFAGHFHGWHDQLIPGADSPPADGDYRMPGITTAVNDDLVIVPPNDLDVLAAALDEHQPACVILEGTGGRWGVVPIRGEFLRGVRRLTEERGILMICDEVITGFRVHPGGSQGHYGFVPDMTTMAKILAGGLPGGALAGRSDLMELLAFENPAGKKMKHPGTFNANPLSAAAGCAALELVSTGEPCRIATERATVMRRRLNELFAAEGVPWAAYGDFSLLKICPHYDGPRSQADDFVPFDGDLLQLDRPIDSGLSHAFRCAMLLHGVDVMGWGAILNAAHSDDDIDRAVDAFAGTIGMLREDGFLA